MDLDQIPSINNENLSLLSLNIQSLPAKFNEFSDLLNDLSLSKINPDLICLQETWQIPDPSLFKIPNYQPIEINSRSLARGGGVGIYIKDGLPFANLSQHSIFVERIFESVFIEIVIDNKKIVVGSVYRPGTKAPGLTFTQQFAEFSEILSQTLSELGSKYDSVYILGDFNLDVLKIDQNRFVSEYVDTLFAYGFLQIITKPTRISGNSATLIDHIITNSTSRNFDSFILNFRVSDHLPILHKLNLKKNKTKQQKLETRNFSSSNINKFKNAIQNFNWNHVISENNCPQTAYSLFNNTFNNLVDTYFPITVVNFNSNVHRIEPWMTTGILTSRRKKNLLCKQLVKKPTTLLRDKFKIFRNIYNNVVRTAKKTYLHSQIENNVNNLRKTWQILYNAIRKSKTKKENCISLLINGVNINDPTLMADGLNKFFTNAASEVVSKINPSNKSPTEHITRNPVSFSLNASPVTITEILNATKSLQDKKTPDLNGISSNFIKKIIFQIIKPLHHIFTLSFEKGIVPSQLKIAKVIPIYKSGDRRSMDNYRPISLLTTFSKIIEKIVATRLTIFLNNNQIISKWQFGFRAQHSTVHPMLHYTNFLSKSFNEKKHSLSIFCDLKKAFDCCDHTILLSKLEKYGIRGTELAWFESYLFNRKQFVSINGKNSSLADIVIGVPQGSILGPLLFLIYINDLPLATKLFTLLFADDTTLLASADSVVSLCNFVNVEFKKVCDFFRANKLMLHPD